MRAAILLSGDWPDDEASVLLKRDEVVFLRDALRRYESDGGQTLGGRLMIGFSFLACDMDDAAISDGASLSALGKTPRWRRLFKAARGWTTARLQADRWA